MSSSEILPKRPYFCLLCCLEDLISLLSLLPFCSLLTYVYIHRHSAIMKEFQCLFIHFSDRRETCFELEVLSPNMTDIHITFKVNIYLLQISNSATFEKLTNSVTFEK